MKCPKCGNPRFKFVKKKEAMPSRPNKTMPRTYDAQVQICNKCGYVS